MNLEELKKQISELQSKVAKLENENKKGIKRWRAKINDKFEAVISNKSYICNIDSLNPFKISIIDSFDRNNELKTELNLILCLPKGDKIDLIIQISNYKFLQ